jgi:hypothetical protein
MTSQLRRGACLIALLGLAVVSCGGQGGQAGSGSSTPNASQPVPSGSGASGPRKGLTSASLNLAAGAVRLEVQAADLGSALYRVTSSDGDPPDVSLNGSTLTVSSRSGNNVQNPQRLTVQLSREVRWSLHLAGGASVEDVALGGAPIESLALAAGANQMNITLGPPRGTVKVEVTGGANALTFRLPSQASASVHLLGAANSVTIDGSDKGLVAGGATYEVGSGGSDRYQIDLLAGLNTLTLTRG